MDFLGNFRLRHTFKERIVLKSLQIDQYNLHKKFSTLNRDLNGPSLDTFALILSFLSVLVLQLGAPIKQTDERTGTIGNAA